MFTQAMQQGLITSLELTFSSVLLGTLLALLITTVLVLRIPVLQTGCRVFIVLFTGTPLLVQIFLIYYGPGQFTAVRESIFWQWLSLPWVCAILALSLNTAAYSTQLFKGACDAISPHQWQACQALGLTRVQSFRILFPYALRRALPSYSNEVILVLKGTALVSNITIMDLTGYAQKFNAQTYETFYVFGIAGLLYLLTNGLLTLLFRRLEKRVLAFENTQ